MKGINKLPLILFIVLQSCGLRNEKNNPIAENDSILQATQLTQIANKVDSNPINKKVLGIWWSSDTSAPSAAFEISKNRVFYIDAFKYCKYKIISDSIKIEYDKNYLLSYRMKFNGKDTLILESDNIDTFHRGKD